MASPESKKGPVYMTGPFICMAGTTRLELATFPHGHAGRSNQNELRLKVFKQLFYESFLFLSFDLFFSLQGAGSIWKFFMINQFPGPFGLCVL